MLISPEEIKAAVVRIAPYLEPTPVLRSRRLSKALDAEVFLKLEIFQPTHSFKVRGAFNAILALPDDVRKKGVVTASGGNHGLGVALACSTLGIPCSVYLPKGTPNVKVNAIHQLQAQVVLHGDVWDDANKLATEIARKEHRAYIHPFNDPKVMAGQATIATELFEQLKNVDVIVASIGGGGLISGIISAVKHFSPKTRVYGVETKGADSMSCSWKAGKIVELPAITSIAESIGAKRTEEPQFEIIYHNIEDIVVVSDQAAITALLELLAEDKIVVEPATSCSVAALTSGMIPIKEGERVAVVMCGGNVSPDKVLAWAAEQSKDPKHLM